MGGGGGCTPAEGAAGSGVFDGSGESEGAGTCRLPRTAELLEGGRDGRLMRTVSLSSALSIPAGLPPRMAGRVMRTVSWFVSDMSSEERPKKSLNPRNLSLPICNARPSFQTRTRRSLLSEQIVSSPAGDSLFDEFSHLLRDGKYHPGIHVRCVPLRASDMRLINEQL